VGTVHGRSALMLRTDVVVVRRTTRGSASSNSIARVVSETWTVTVYPAWTRPRAIFRPQTTMTSVAEARRCTRAGSEGAGAVARRGGRRAAGRPGRGERGRGRGSDRERVVPAQCHKAG
jgi:hypothetical protein